MNRKRFTEVFQAFQSPLYHYLFRMCGSKETAEELLQETFYRSLLSLRFEKTMHIRAWLFKVARNLFIDWHRRKSRESAMIRRMEPHSGENSLQGPEERLEQLERRSMVEKVMRQMPEHYRTILYLREIEGFSYQELAELLEISMDRVKVNLYRSKQKFKQIVQELEGGNINE